VVSATGPQYFSTPIKSKRRHCFMREERGRDSKETRKKISDVRFGASLARTKKNTFFRNATPCYLLVTANIVPSSLILVTLLMEAIHSSETSILKRATVRHILEEAFFRTSHSEYVGK
jgi:hypothetical protein